MRTGYDGPPATPRTTLAANLEVSAICRCGHSADLDLPAIVASRWADHPLPTLPLRCERCRGRDVSVVVSGARYAGY